MIAGRTGLFAVALSLLIGCANKHGSISGGAYWRDVEGNRPDTGTEVFLFPADTSIDPLKTICDAQGNFSFTNVPVGDYSLVARSRATTSSYADQLHAFVDYLYTPLIGFDLRQHSRLISHFIDVYYGAERHSFYRGESERLADSIFHLMPGDSPFNKWLYHTGLSKDEFARRNLTMERLGLNRVKIQKLTVGEGKPARVMIDFGQGCDQ